MTTERALLVCPECGSERTYVTGTIRALMTRDGTEEFIGDFEFSENEEVECAECHHFAIAEAFEE